MRIKAISICLFIIINCIRASGQTAYLFNYNFRSETDTTSYSCLYFRNEDWTGLLKLKYNDPATGRPVVKELFVEDSYFTNPDDEGYPKILAIKTAFKEAEQASKKPTAPVFIFNENMVSGFFDPAGVSVSSETHIITTETSFSSKRFNKGEMTKEFAAGYFDKRDPFYISWFTPTRGGMVLNPFEQKDLKLHLILVADTLDKSIGKSAAKDLRNMQQTFTQFSQLMGIKKENFRQQVFAGKQCESRYIMNAVNKLAPGPEDIVVFYYSGHGFRTNGVDTFPYMKCTNINTDSATIVKYSLRIKDVYDKIASTKAKVKLVLSDCCNNNIEQPKDRGNPLPKTRGEWEMNEKNARALFRGYKPVSILLTAAKNGQKAILDTVYSSYMTYAFMGALKQYTGKLEYNVSWEKLLEKTGVETKRLAGKTCCSKPCCGPSCTTGRAIGCVQTSVYKIAAEATKTQ